MILLDSSIWIATFQKTRPLNLERVVDFSLITTCLPVIQEVLQGFRDETAYRKARQAMLALPIVESPLSTGVIEDAVGLYRAAKRQGLSIRSSVDCLIAACALRNNLVLLHQDRDYSHLARVSLLKVKTLK